MSFFKRNKDKDDKNDAAMDAAANDFIGNIPEEYRRNMQSLGVNEKDIVDYFKFTYKRDNPREEQAFSLENNASALIHQAELDLANHEPQHCLEKLIKARVALFEAGEIHKEVSETHPGLKLIQIGLNQIDRSISVVRQLVDHLGNDDYPDYPVY